MANRTVRRKRKARKRIGRIATSIAADAIGPLAPDEDIFVLSDGSFSLIDALQHCIDWIGPCSVDIATWSATATDIVRLDMLRKEGIIDPLRLIIDPSFFTRKTGNTNLLVNTFGSDIMRTIPSHAKVNVLRNGSWDLVLRTTANLNQNRRTEFFEVGHDPDLADLLTTFFDDVFARSPDTNFRDRTTGALDVLFDGGPLDFDNMLKF